MKLSQVILITLALVSFNATSHGGRTNSSGCHTNSKTGDYHCHNKKASTTQTTAPKYCHVIAGERRCGYAKSSCTSLKEKWGGSCEKQ
jgi:hypothetical protein